MRRQQRRSNPDYSNIVDGLLRLGDVTRNNQLGEARSALEKAKALIAKFQLTRFTETLAKRFAALERAERGEKVERDETRSEHAQHQQHDAYDAWARQRAQERAQREQQRWKDRDERAARRRQGREERKRTQRHTRTAWIRPSVGAKIVWTYHKNWRMRGMGGTNGEARWQAGHGAKTVADAYAAGVKWRDLRRWELRGLITIQRGDA